MHQANKFKVKKSQKAGCVNGDKVLDILLKPLNN